MKQALDIYLGGSALTLLAAGTLAVLGLWALAGLVILVSPFPCPPGLPC